MTFLIEIVGILVSLCIVFFLCFVGVFAMRAAIIWTGKNLFKIDVEEWLE